MSEFLTSTYDTLEYPGLKRITPQEAFALVKSVLYPTIEMYNPELSKLDAVDDYIYLNQDIADVLDSVSSDDFQDETSLAGKLKSYDKKYSKSEGYKATKAELEKQVKDPVKRQILLGIAAHESGYNPNAKNAASSAYGLFLFIKSNQKKYGYGKDIASQVAAASRLYDDNLKLLNKWISLYGNRGLSLYKMMNGMWFNPNSMKQYLATGKSKFRDKQGTSFNKVLARKRNGGIIQKRINTN